MAPPGPPSIAPPQHCHPLPSPIYQYQKRFKHAQNSSAFPPFISESKNKGRCAQIPAIFENLIPRPEEKKDIFTDTPIFDD